MVAATLQGGAKPMNRISLARCSFVADTLAHTEQGVMPIEKIRVGEAAVWVHNANCSRTEAIESTLKKVELPPEVQVKELEDACFSGDTPVIVEEGYDRGECQVSTFEKIWMWAAMMAGISNWEECPEISLEETGIDFKVLSRDEQTGEITYKRILKMFNHGFRKINDIYCKYGPQYRKNCGDGQVISVTDEHPFWVQGKGWTPVCNLCPGDEFITYNGDPTVVEKVEPAGYSDRVFNMAVEDFHSYFVGLAGIWVHNTKQA
jgi:hypothetical protein